MANKHTSAAPLIALLVALSVILAAVTGAAIWLHVTQPEAEATEPQTTLADTTPTETEQTEPPTTEATEPEPVHTVATATLGSMGDLLMHEPVFSNAKTSDGTYDFEPIFRYLAGYVSALDYAAINLETTLAGTDNGYSYSGYPLFNCPDEIVDGAKDAGFDMLLTANNHSYDTKLVGYKRTVEVIARKGLQTLGTYADADDPKWTVVDVNGISIGMLCYTYATGVSDDGRPSLNANAPIAEQGLCNYFYSGQLPAFYSQVETYLDQLEQAGAEATVMYIHWGQEYLLAPNAEQKAIAQQLCDLGIDVIIGGHPHVVEPIELLSSTVDADYKTVCLYSMGNAVSNQRQGHLSAIKTAHTEDGLLFTVTFQKSSDGTVRLSDVQVLPTWVNMHTAASGRREYNILPLDDTLRDSWQSLYGLTQAQTLAAERSYDRTMTIIAPGLTEVQQYLAQQEAPPQ